ncbi:nicotinate phosphoribosyltransferase [Vibrio phage RYC]|nr:nicotinate phosphoribosyltransferase [Vibrio phage RYC]
MTVSFAPAQADFYKWGHPFFLDENILGMYGNYTNRNGRLSNIPEHITDNKVAHVGLQYFIKDVLLGEWQETFFDVPKHIAVEEMCRIAKYCLQQPDYPVEIFEELHDLGYLPIRIKSLPEGSAVPYQVPPMTIRTTNDRFAWLEGFLETVYSTENWGISTSATTSRAYYKQIKASLARCGMSDEDIAGILPFLCHDFSMRGMFGRHAAAASGFGHLASGFAGTDTIPAILFAEKYYGAHIESELVGASVNATEHSVTTSAIAVIMKETGVDKLQAEVEFVRRLLKKYPTGIISHVSDSYDFWKFVTEGLPQLKEEIMAREGKLVIRPDSGDPVKILTGYKVGVLDPSNHKGISTLIGNAKTIEEVEAVLDPETNKYFTIDNFEQLLQGAQRPVLGVELQESEVKGLIQVLFEEFGGTQTETGYVVLDEHIGAIYGDSITLQRQHDIITRLEDKKYVPLVVLGVGSYSFQYVTRDTHGSAIKSTAAFTEDGVVEVYKDPATDSKKKSAKGLLRVEKENGEYVLYDQQTYEQEKQGLLEVVFEDGKLVKEVTLAEVRAQMLEDM